MATPSTPLLQPKETSRSIENYTDRKISKTKTYIRNEKAVLQIIIDAILLIVLNGLVILLNTDYFMTFRRGFFCDDDSIRYPYKPSTVTTLDLYLGGLGTPIAIMVLTEILQKPAKLRGACENVIICGCHVPVKLQNIYIHVIPFLYGALVAEFTSDFTKLCVGRLRPNFLDACLPDYNCSTARDPHIYVLNYTCTNPDLSINSINIRQSFPSGHSAVVSFCALYTAVYLQKYLRCSISKFLKPSIQLICFLLAIYTAISRIEDNKHHWSDVLAGIIIGVIIFGAILKLYPICSTHSYDKENDEEQPNISEENGIK